MTVRIDEKPEITQQTTTTVGSTGNVVTTPGSAISTARSEISVDAPPAKAFYFKREVRLAEIVQAINDIGASPSDLVAILEALKIAGALKAELIII